MKNVQKIIDVIRKVFTKRQNDACAICAVRFHFLDKYPALDHCHIKGHCRGVLCDRCNRGLGFFKDSPELLQAAIRYLGQDFRGNPIHPEFESEQAVIGLARRDFNYTAWLAQENLLPTAISQNLSSLESRA